MKWNSEKNQAEISFREFMQRRIGDPCSIQAPTDSEAISIARELGQQAASQTPIFCNAFVVSTQKSKTNS